MDFFDWYFKQVVTQGQMDWAFAQVETAIDRAAADPRLFGIMDGLDATEHSAVPDLTVDVSSGTAYDSDGQRIHAPDPVTVVNCAVDEYGVPTDPPTPGNQRYLAVFAAFARELTDPAVDGNGITVYTHHLESRRFFVRQGAEAAPGAAVRPALIADAELIADVLLTHGQTAILNAHLDTTRRQDWLRAWADPALGYVAEWLVHGTPDAAIEEVWRLWNAHVSDLDWFHTAGALPYTPGQDWFGAVPLTGPAPPVESIGEALDAILFDLAQTAAGGGAHKIGMDAVAGTPESFPGDSLAVAIAAIFGHLNARTERATEEDITKAWMFDVVGARTARGGSLNDEMTWDNLGKVAWWKAPWGHAGMGANLLDPGGGAWVRIGDVCTIYRPGLDRNPKLCVLGQGAGGWEVAVIDGWQTTPTVEIKNITLGAMTPAAMCSVGDSVAILYRDAGPPGNADAYVMLWEPDFSAPAAGWAGGLLLTNGGSTLQLDATKARAIVWAADDWLVVASGAEDGSTGRVFAGVQLSAVACQWVAAGDVAAVGDVFSGGLASDGTQVKATVINTGLSRGTVNGAIILTGGPAGGGVLLKGGGGANWYVANDIIYDGNKFWFTIWDQNVAPNPAQIGVWDAAGVHDEVYNLIGESARSPHLCFDGLTVWVQDYSDATGLYAVWGTAAGAFGLWPNNSPVPGYAQRYEPGHTPATTSGGMAFDGAHVWCIPYGGGGVPAPQYLFRVPNAAYRT